jgi:hypothetical protein
MMEKQKVDDCNLDFVFTDSKGDPYRVRKMDGEYWICWMHPDKQWVSLRKVTGWPELWHMQNACINWVHHEQYALGIPFDPSGEGWPSHDSPATQFKHVKN